ncbi:cytochrome P450 [Sphingobium sp. JS3065]|jgi:cytochrome P450|uniref:cytochrome P450 n=1 Tax=Sphingobium sp. JS3065 TaxID=2970925 RepID=UPI002264C93E|nr:cytochrome P450 [Sphingobium sp. JS3065]UZW57240.1 cytochrome P450 [Sphingobium sp. JS3065]
METDEIGAAASANGTVELEGCPITFTNPETRRCPFPAYHKLREEQPVYKDPVSGNYILTRYRDVRKAAMDTKVLSCKTGVIQTRASAISDQINKMFEEQGFLPMDTLVTNDPPEHRTYRTLVDKAFTRDKVQSLEPQIEKAVKEMIDGFIEKDEIDFFDEFAMRLPLAVFTEILGVTDRDLDKFKRWNDMSLETSNPALSPERELELVPAVIELQQYLAKNVERVRAAPDDSLLSTLVHAEVNGRTLNMRELISILWLLFLAGGETTANAIAGGMAILIERPELIDEIRSDPKKLDAFIEETLRIKTPATTMFRRATADLEIGGVHIPAGSLIETRYGAANLDPEIFPEPETVDLERENARSHLTFGSGIHLCIGNQLAREEMRASFRQLVERMHNFRTTRGEQSYSYTSTYVAYGLTELWMTFDKR